MGDGLYELCFIYFQSQMKECFEKLLENIAVYETTWMRVSVILTLVILHFNFNLQLFTAVLLSSTVLMATPNY
jgi:hypothetical protein